MIPTEWRVTASIPNPSVLPIQVEAVQERDKSRQKESTLPPHDDIAMHDDFGLHDFKVMYAELADGRTAEVVIDEAGHIQIVGFLEPWQESEPPKPPVGLTQGRASSQPKPQQGKGQKPLNMDGLATAMAEAKQKAGKERGGELGSDAPETMTVTKGTILPVERDSVFQAKLLSVMNDNQFDRRLKGRTRGKLDMTRLYKAPTGAQGIFTLKSMRRNKKYNVVMVVDQSGSMFDQYLYLSKNSMNAWSDPASPTHMVAGSKIEVAGEACQFLAEHFNRIPGLDLMILGYSGRHTVHKKFGDRTNLKMIKSRVVTWGGGGTRTAEALQVAYEALMKKTDGQNILLLLTDGSSDRPSDTTDVLQHYRHVATTIGIGIQSVAEPAHSFVIDDLTSLKPAIIWLLQQEIKRG